MKYLFLLVIRTYQLIFPKKLRGKCLYHESCSNHVLRVTRTRGLIPGLQSLMYRFKNCRPGYKLMKVKDEILLITIDNEVINQKEMDKRLLREINITDG